MIVAKFVPYNSNTLAGIINKKVKFSTVFEFNDFNEYGYISPPEDMLSEIEGLIEMLKENFQRLDFRNYLLKLAKDRTSLAYSQQVEAYLKDHEKSFIFPKHDEISHQLIAECLAFTKVGIFSCADKDVLQDASAQVMFAHYGHNLEGLVLLYEVNESEIYEINYEHELVAMSIDCILNWVRGDFNRTNMPPFLNKANPWQYEHEKRIFRAPGIQSVNELKLLSILYTPRFTGCLETLKEVNKKFYENSLKIESIYSSYGSMKRFMLGKDGTPIFEWIKTW